MVVKHLRPWRMYVKAASTHLSTVSHIPIFAVTAPFVFQYYTEQSFSMIPGGYDPSENTARVPCSLRHLLYCNRGVWTEFFYC